MGIDYFSKARTVFQILRPGHWVKNGFVFLPVFFGAKFFDSGVLLNTCICFIAFCLASSSMYVLNDYLDRESDKDHPVKKHRLSVSGEVSTITIKWIFGILILILLLLFVILQDRYFYVIFIYILLNLLYNIKLKQVALIDVMVLSLGYVLRILAGGMAGGVVLSNWIVILTFLLALMLALGKRRGELQLQKQIPSMKARKSITDYNVDFLNISIVLIASVTLVSYLIYCISPEVIDRIGNDKLYITAIFVVAGILRYLQQTIVFSNTESPVNFLYRDTFIQITIALWLISFAFLIYVLPN